VYRKLVKEGCMFFSHPLETGLIAEPRIESDGVDARASAELTKFVVVTTPLLDSNEMVLVGGL
jgi:16S rRNA G527 N7-methylase RsmG